MRRSQQQQITQNLPAIPDLPRGAAELAMGRVVCLEATSRGGVMYEPAIVEAHGHTKLKTQIQQVDDPALDKWVTQVRNAAQAVVRAHAVHIDIGMFFATERAYEKIEEEMEPCRKEARAINARAKHLKSNRETRCEIWPFGWNPSDVRLALRMGQLLFTRLTSMKESYTSKDKDRYRVEKDRCRNLETLVVGEQSRLVQAALRASEEQRTIMVAHYGGVNFPREWGSKVPAFDFKPIDAAIKLFAPAEELFLLEKVS